MRSVTLETLIPPKISTVKVISPGTVTDHDMPGDLDLLPAL